MAMPTSEVPITVSRHPITGVLLLLFFACWGLAPATTLASDYPQSRDISYQYEALPRADKVVVYKGEQRLVLERWGTVIREYPIVMGPNPVGHKRYAGDGRTPEGEYLLDWRNPDSRFYRSIHISYPNEYDIANAEARGVDPGRHIMIHGSPNWVPSSEWAKQWLYRDNWTEGCIAVTNEAMDEIWLAVEDGTPIVIKP